MIGSYQYNKLHDMQYCESPNRIRNSKKFEFLNFLIQKAAGAWILIKKLIMLDAMTVVQIPVTNPYIKFCDFFNFSIKVNLLTL